MYCVSGTFVALSLCVLCFEESVLCYQCVCVVFSMCVVFCTYGPPYISYAVANVMDLLVLKG